MTTMTKQQVQDANYSATAAYRVYCQNQNDETFKAYQQAVEFCEKANKIASEAGFIDEIGISLCVHFIR